LNGFRFPLGSTRRCAAVLALAAGALGCADESKESPQFSVQPGAHSSAEGGKPLGGDLAAARRGGEAVVVASHFAERPEWENLPLVPLPAVTDEFSPRYRTSLPPDELAAAPGGPTLLPPQSISEMESQAVEAPAPTAPPDEADHGHAIAAWNPEAAAEAAALLADAAPPITGSLTGAVVSERAQASIRKGNALAQRGASFAARREFIDVLRMIAQAKDQKYGAPRRSTALSNGLRALDEAADFSPRGAAFESRLNLDVIISSHRTPVAKSPQAEGLMAQQLAALYFRYAQLQLGAAVSGEPAGSMALHALGKLYSQLGRMEADKYPLAERHAFTLQQAALLARSDNYMAAHELGVLLAESGHYGEAAELLGQVATYQPHAVVLRNLSRVHRKLGNTSLAGQLADQSRSLEQQLGDDGSPVMWVDPMTLARTMDSMTPAATSPTAPATAGQALPHPRVPWAAVVAPMQQAQRPSPGFFQ
jgi:tetratricopeptide (TPR) repeat protein